MLTILSQFLIEIIAAVILVPFILKYGRRLVKYIRNRKFEGRMKKVYKIYEEIGQLRSYLGSERVLLLRTTNGGGLPGPGKVLYASIIAEVDGPNLINKPMRDEWQNRLIDHDYIRMLERVYVDGSTTNVVSEMPEHSLLRGAYEKIGVTQTRVVKIGIHNDAFYYLSIACEAGRELSHAEKYSIDTSVQKINKLLK